MKQTIIKGSVFTFIFLIASFAINVVMNKGNTDMTAEMDKATLPIVSVDLDGMIVNHLYGYRNEMDVAYNKDNITPMGDNRSLSFLVQTFGMDLESITVEVRTLNGERLIERTIIDDYIEREDVIEANIIIKDLINPQEEYNLIVILKPERGDEIRYYTRIIEDETSYAEEMVDYALGFSEATFDKEDAKVIIRHLETNQSADNSDISEVSIYSNFNQITWGDLEVNRVGEIDIKIKEIVGEIATIELEYYVEEKVKGASVFYQISEYYKIRMLSEDTIFVLKFERLMDKVLDFSNNSFIGKHILLGITSEDIDLVESEEGTMVSFVYNNQLFAYDTNEDKAIRVFSFFDSENTDKRSMHGDHDIKILNIDETGHIRFMVYGYMNRGHREGEVGIFIYSYNGLVNTIEEEIFIPYGKSVELLKYEVRQLSYVNKNNILYLFIENTIYSIDLVKKKADIIITNLTEDKIEVSDNNETIAWQSGNDVYNSLELTLMNLNTEEKKTIEAGSGNRIEPLGFMGEDLIYGIAKKEDITIDKAGRTIFPMFEIRIGSENSGISKIYQEEGIFIETCEIDENQISLSRIIKDEEGNFLPTTDDHILNNQKEKEDEHKIEKVAVDIYQIINQIELNHAKPEGAIQFLTPKEVMYEGDRSVEINNEEDIQTKYYVYGKDGISNVFTKPSQAINLAKEITGVVLNEDGYYVWENTNKLKKNQIMAIKGSPLDAETNSTAVCLDTIFKYEGISRNSEYMLNRGDTVIQILQDNLVDYQVLDLSQCTLDAVLYYISKEIPILVMLEDGKSLLVIGYNETEVVLLDPLRNPKLGNIYKEKITVAREIFEENGNSFISYIPKVN